MPVEETLVGQAWECVCCPWRVAGPDREEAVTLSVCLSLKMCPFALQVVKKARLASARSAQPMDWSSSGSSSQVGGRRC